VGLLPGRAPHAVDEPAPRDRARVPPRLVTSAGTVVQALREIARAAGPLVGVLPLLVLSQPASGPSALRVLHVFAAPLAVLGTAGCLLGLLADRPAWRGAGRAALDRLAWCVQGRRGLVLVFLVTLAVAATVRAGLISSDPADSRREHLLTGD